MISKKISVSFFLAFWLWNGFALAMGNEAPPKKRIITLMPAIGELTADILHNDINQIIGVSDFSDYPPALKKIPIVGSFSKINIEKIVSLKPDLVIASNDANSKDQLNRLKALGIRTIMLKLNSFAEIKNSIQTVATALERGSVGEKMVAHLDKGLNAFRDRAKKRPAKKLLRVMLQLSDEPLIVVGKKSFLNEAVALLGAKNIYDDQKQGYPRPSKEDVLERNPDVIVLLTQENYRKKFQALATRWKRFKSLNAVKTDKIKLVISETLTRPSLRILEGLSMLEKAIYGDKT